MGPDFRGVEFPGAAGPATGRVRGDNVGAPKRLFLAVLFCAYAVCLGSFCIALWLIQPRLASIHPSATHALLIAACAAIMAFAVAYSALCLSVWLKRPLRLADSALRLFVRSLPLVSAVAPLFGVSSDRLRQSLKSLEQHQACLLARVGCRGRIVCLAPADLPALAVGQIRSVAAEYDSGFLQIASATEARQLILQVRPVAAVAVCCPPDTVRRIRELQYRMPLFTVGRRPKSCAVCEVSPDIHELMAVLEALRAQYEETDADSEAVPARPRH